MWTRGALSIARRAPPKMRNWCAMPIPASAKSLSRGWLATNTWSGRWANGRPSSLCRSASTCATSCERMGTRGRGVSWLRRTVTVRPPALHIQARRRLPSRTAILPLHALQIRARHLREARAAELCTFWRRSAARTRFNVLSELASIADSLRLVQCATQYSPQPLITRMRWRRPENKTLLSITQCPPSSSLACCSSSPCISSSSPSPPPSRFFSKTGDTDMNGPVMRESEVLVLGELPC